MDLLDKISFWVLLNETAEVRQLLENLVNLKRELYSEISIGILPFVSSLSMVYCISYLKSVLKNSQISENRNLKKLFLV